ncbi:hypothetical protein J31TS4_40490 [Paenibacillus sp. J31TS4]|uniref:hypothetical protein n=1 Tax=Paenibacillus sp. J31TS4 TaxID=2807195 RepID=UPI001B05EE26|nr:hypothetical protein [Paenibacillus sp. J31TS4]GIP40769.1 hypothetical protein J31TS4_40490 [Paenibacillus sp. J31TS4]
MDHISVIEKHTIHDQIKGTLHVMSELILNDGLDPEHRIQIDRINHVIFILQTVLEKSDPLMISTGVLDTLNSNLNNINNYMSHYQSNPNSSYLNNALTHVDQVCVSINNLYVPVDVGDIETIRESAVSFRHSLGQHLRHSVREAEENNTLIQKLREEISTLKREIDLEKSRADNVISDFQRQFSEAEATRQREYSASLEERYNKFSEEINKIKGDSTEFHSFIEEEHQNQLRDASLVFEDIRRLQTKAKGILGTMSVDGHAAGYKKEADDAKISKQRWQKVTVGLFLGLIASAIFNTLHSGEFSWAIIASKWSVTLAIGAAVTYCATQATKLDRVERENRNMELQMATIDPYLEIFNEEERKEVKKLLVDRIFTGVKVVKEDEKITPAIPTSDLLKLVETVVRAIKK